jgi:hypothetical protein
MIVILLMAIQENLFYSTAGELLIATGINSNYFLIPRSTIAGRGFYFLYKKKQLILFWNILSDTEQTLTIVQ